MSEILDIPQIGYENFSQDSGGGKFTKVKFPKIGFGKKVRLPNFNKKIVLPIVGIIGVIIVLLVIFGILPALNVYKKAKILQASAENLKTAVASQNIANIKNGLDDLNSKLLDLQGSYKSLAWSGGMPFIGSYWHDGDHAINAGVQGLDAAKDLVVTIEPYADIIGFGGSGSTAKSGEDTANDRIEFLIQTISDVLPKLDGISQKALAAKQELDLIDPNRYPEQFRGIKIREKMKQGLALADEATSVITDGKPLLEQAPYLLGIDSPRTYLVLFQNDKELRPTGGFLTAYSIMQVNKGKLQPVTSSDMYTLDAHYKPAIMAPQELRDYLKGPYAVQRNFFLRDLNWNPDFKASMDTFTTEAQKAGIQKVDGVIAVDTNVLVKLLDVLGTIGVPGFGNFSNQIEPKCNCPQVIYELENFADIEGPVVWSENTGEIVYAPKNYGKNRKEIVGPLMNSVLSNALGQPSEKLPELFQAGWESLTEKHVLFYMFDPKAEAAVESFGIGGTIKDYDGDYLQIVDANLGGRKSNLYVTQEVTQEITKATDGAIEKTLTITYKNPQAYDGWLNSVLPNWTRIYVPKGSQLISTDGFEDKKDPYEENGKTVFAGGFQLRPEGLAKITVKYRLPYKATHDYKLFVQKQPGIDSPLYTVIVGKQEEEAFLKTDQKFSFKL